jgi:uncharacterized protein (TIGR02466 family)
MSLTQHNFFITPIYSSEKIEWLEKINQVTDSYILDAKERNKSNLINNRDFNTVHHSTALTGDENFKEFLQYINSNAFDILNNQGFNLTDYFLATTELWVQEFSSLGGGNHSPHVHWNGHVSGFYFLKCSGNTSYPIFHDPRVGKLMNSLPEKNISKVSDSSSLINFKPKPGTFIFFNSYLQHEFPVDAGIEPFRFIHFNIQAFPKGILNYK